jgi:hypothetical protein
MSALKPNTEQVLGVGELFINILSHMDSKTLLIGTRVSRFWRDTILNVPELHAKTFLKQVYKPMPKLDGIPTPVWNRLIHDEAGFFDHYWVNLLTIYAFRRIDPSLRIFMPAIRRWIKEFKDMPLDKFEAQIPPLVWAPLCPNASWRKMYVCQPPVKAVRVIFALTQATADIGFDFKVLSRSLDRGVIWDDVIHFLEKEIRSLNYRCLRLIEEDEENSVIRDTEAAVELFSLLFKAALESNPTKFFGFFILSRKGLIPEQKQICHDLTWTRSQEGFFIHYAADDQDLDGVLNGYKKSFLAYVGLEFHIALFDD